MTDIGECPLRVGQRVKVVHPKYGEEWSGRGETYLITGVRWLYQRIASPRFDIEIASDDEIKDRNGSTDGWSVGDLLVVSAEPLDEESRHGPC